MFLEGIAYQFNLFEIKIENNDTVIIYLECYQHKKTFKPLLSCVIAAITAFKAE
jgi:hypothetical protein